MKITKLDAARRQIDAAIGLYFNEGDEIAVHTLVGAAHILVIDLSKAAQLQSVIDRHITPEMRWKFEGVIRKPQNFLKHAEDHPDERRVQPAVSSVSRDARNLDAESTAR